MHVREKLLTQLFVGCFNSIGRFEWESNKNLKIVTGSAKTLHVCVFCKAGEKS